MSKVETEKTESDLAKREAELPEGVESTRAGREFLPRTDIYETEKSVVIVADLPGVAADGIDLSLERDLLTLRGRVNRDGPGTEGLAYREYEIGDFVRSFKLSGEVDREKIEARAKDGVLTLTIPKVGMSRKQIAVSVG
jgi:HSP20 family molecular chaperone IbpA